MSTWLPAGRIVSRYWRIARFCARYSAGVVMCDIPGCYTTHVPTGTQQGTHTHIYIYIYISGGAPNERYTDTHTPCGTMTRMSRLKDEKGGRHGSPGLHMKAKRGRTGLQTSFATRARITRTGWSRAWDRADVLSIVSDTACTRIDQTKPH